jgi:hypothetical protein
LPPRGATTGPGVVRRNYSEVRDRAGAVGAEDPRQTGGAADFPRSRPRAGPAFLPASPRAGLPKFAVLTANSTFADCKAAAAWFKAHRLEQDAVARLKTSTGASRLTGSASPANWRDHAAIAEEIATEPAAEGGHHRRVQGVSTALLRNALKPIGVVLTENDVDDRVMAEFQTADLEASEAALKREGGTFIPIWWRGRGGPVPSDRSRANVRVGVLGDHCLGGQVCRFPGIIEQNR